MPKKKTLTDKLKNLRAANKLTQAEVAKKLNISQQQYSNIELGKGNLDSSTIIALCKLYGISSDYLLGIEEKAEKPKPETPKTEQVSYERELTPEEIEMLVEKKLKAMMSQGGQL